MNNKLHSVPLAVGEFVVLETKATHPSDLEEKTSSGIIIKSNVPDFSKAIPKHAIVVSKGNLVPDSEISIGDIVSFPSGGHSYNIEDPRVIEGNEVTKDEKRQFCYVHWKNIGAKFIELKETK